MIQGMVPLVVADAWFVLEDWRIDSLRALHDCYRTVKTSAAGSQGLPLRVCMQRSGFGSSNVVPVVPLMATCIIFLFLCARA